MARPDYSLPIPSVTAVPASFPETRSDILAEAAAGQWSRFFAEYLAPCWQSIVGACRHYRLHPTESDDLFQELCLRLMREGKPRQMLGAAVGDVQSQEGNIPDRYLKHRDSYGDCARFRTYIKSVIRNLLCEHFRRTRRGPFSLNSPANQVSLETCIDESILFSVDQQWVRQCLQRTVIQMRQESLDARSKGKRRWFAVLCSATIDGKTPSQIAVDWGLERSTVADLLLQARKRFVELLAKSTGIQDRQELKKYVKTMAEELVTALRQAQNQPMV